MFMSNLFISHGEIVSMVVNKPISDKVPSHTKVVTIYYLTELL